MQADPIRVFWVPGCSACVKIKEFLTGLGVPFESVNLLENEQGAADLARLGARSLPVVSRGEKFVFAQSLNQVAEFVGKHRGEAETLDPADLMARWTDVLAIARSHAARIPPDRLMHRPIPGRARTVLELAYHIFQVPDAFLRNVAGEFEDWAQFVNMPPPPEMRTADDIARYADAIRGDLDQWWDALEEKECLWTVRTYYGVRPAWELLERQTWHSAQHTRQLQAVLEGFGVPLERKATAATYAGLPMPNGIWE